MAMASPAIMTSSIYFMSALIVLRKLNMDAKQLKTGCRIPCEYILVAGAGQSNQGPGIDPWETCAYDLALLEAGIENFNVVKYTSVLPPESRRITMEEAQERGLFHHGMVLECIMAQVDGKWREHICAGVGRAQVYREVNGERVHIGGFASEYEGYQSRDFARKCLEKSLQGIFKRRYKEEEGYTMEDVHTKTKDLVVNDEYGTVLVAIGFLTFQTAPIS
jgi:arginine decarboxylase